MRRILAGVAVAFMLMVGAAVAQQAKAPSQIVVTAAELKWGEPPPVFEKGASFTVVSGDPGKAGIFVVRLKMPAGYKVAAHWHPTDEHVCHRHRRNVQQGDDEGSPGWGLRVPAC